MKKWGKGIVEQLSLDLQSEFPDEKGFSARNLWNMKKWYLFYASSDIFSEMAHTIEDSIDLNSLKLQQVGAEIIENPKTDTSICYSIILFSYANIERNYQIYGERQRTYSLYDRNRTNNVCLQCRKCSGRDAEKIYRKPRVKRR